MKRTIILTLLLLTLIGVLVYADAELSFSDEVQKHENCIIVNESYIAKEAQYEIKEVCFNVSLYDSKEGKNKTTEQCENRSERIEDKQTTKYRLSKVNCSPYYEMTNKTLRYHLQGYNCSHTAGADYLTCDSLLDGNGDGICDPRGGETCCRVYNNTIKCKNSVVDWDSTSAAIPVEVLQYEQ